MALLLLMFILGAVAGTLVTWAIVSDDSMESDPTEFGGTPL